MLINLILAVALAQVIFVRAFAPLQSGDGKPEFQVDPITESQELKSAFQSITDEQRKLGIELGKQEVIRLPQTKNELASINCTRIREILVDQQLVEFQLPSFAAEINDIVRNRTMTKDQQKILKKFPKYVTQGDREQSALKNDTALVYYYFKNLGSTISQCVFKQNIQMQEQMASVIYVKRTPKSYKRDDFHADETVMTLLIPDHKFGGLQFYPGYKDQQQQNVHDYCDRETKKWNPLKHCFPNWRSSRACRVNTLKQTSVTPDLKEGRAYLFAGKLYEQAISQVKKPLEIMHHAVPDTTGDPQGKRASYVIAVYKSLNQSV